MHSVILDCWKLSNKVVYALQACTTSQLDTCLTFYSKKKKKLVSYLMHEVKSFAG